MYVKNGLQIDKSINFRCLYLLFINLEKLKFDGYSIGYYLKERDYGFPCHDQAEGRGKQGC